MAMKTAFAALSLCLAAAAADCDTMERIGEDISAAGAAVDDAAEDARKSRPLAFASHGYRPSLIAAG